MNVETMERERKATPAQQMKIKDMAAQLGLQLENYLFAQTLRTQILSMLRYTEALMIIAQLTTLSDLDKHLVKQLRKNIYTTLDSISVYAPNLRTAEGFINQLLIDDFLRNKTTLQKRMFEMNIAELRVADALFKEMERRYKSASDRKTKES